MVLSPLRKYLYGSFWFHASVLLGLMFFPSFLGKPHLFHQEKIVWVSLPKGMTNEIGPPMKKSEGLPKTTIEEQRKALESPPKGSLPNPRMTYTRPPTPKKAEIPKTPVPKRPGHPGSPIENALERVRKQVASKTATPEAGQIPQTQPGGFTFGTSTGPYVSPDDPEYVIYQAKIRQRIMNQWILPMKYADQALGPDLGLICRIVVHINERGEVVQKEWQLKSENPSFDLSAMRSIEKASPLDIPPDRLKYEVFNEGFMVEFKPTAATQTAQ